MEFIPNIIGFIMDSGTENIMEFVMDIMEFIMDFVVVPFNFYVSLSKFIDAMFETFCHDLDFIQCLVH